MDTRAADSTRDAEAIAAIYAPYIVDTVISFEDLPPTPAEMAARAGFSDFDDQLKRSLLAPADPDVVSDLLERAAGRGSR